MSTLDTIIQNLENLRTDYSKAVKGNYSASRRYTKGLMEMQKALKAERREHIANRGTFGAEK